MTRKQALNTAIAILSAEISNQEVIDKLQEIAEEYPLHKWTEGSILDAIETYAAEHNNTLPLVAELTTPNKLPSITAIRRVFKLPNDNMTEFYSTHFQHLKPTNKSNSKYRYEEYEYFIDIFKNNYNQIKEKTQLKKISTRIYEKYKEENTPHIYTIIKNCNCRTYDELLILCGYKKEKKALVASTHVSYTEDEKKLNDIKNVIKIVQKRVQK